MSPRINTPKPCLYCRKLMHPNDCKNPAAFRAVKYCSPVCGGMGRAQGVGMWDRLMAYRVKHPMEFEEIAKVAGVSRQRIFQIYESAISKIQNNRRGSRVLREFR